MIVATFIAPQNRKNRRSEERGAILIMTSLVMLLLLFIAAFATDLGAWYRQGQAQQQASDVSSLNGVQAYERATRAHLEALGYAPPSTNNPNIPEADRLDAEELGLEAALTTVLGILETSGFTFDMNTVQRLQTEVPPGESIWYIEADDGTKVTVTRVTETTPSGESVTSLRVTLEGEGEQFFSNLLRDAPEISRTASAVLSNCGAFCDRTLVIEPPFAGFDADGSGDGYQPLLHGDTEVWAVNHHANETVQSDIVCMDRDTESACTPNGLFSLGPVGSNASGYNTPLAPVELLSNRVGKIYFPATDRATNRGGVACFDVDRRQHCTTPFTGFWDARNDLDTCCSVALGVWEWDEKVFVLSDEGKIACVTTSADASGGMVPCGDWDTAVTGEGAIALPTTPFTGFWGTHNNGWGHLITEGSRAGELHIISGGTNRRPYFHCFDLDNGTECWGGNWVAPPGADIRGTNPLAFARYDSTGTYQGICWAAIRPSTHHCVSESGVSEGAILPGLNAALDPLDDRPDIATFTGVAYNWQNKRVFFNGGASDNLTCYNFETSPSSTCGQLDTEAIRPGENASHNGAAFLRGSTSQELQPYNLNEVTPNCLIGLGDQSFFFSFNPETLDPCVDTRVSAPILPCVCGDLSAKWGVIQFPQELLDNTAILLATITADEAGNNVIQGIQNVDLIASNGVLDLSSVTGHESGLWLHLDIEAVLDMGEVVWDDDVEVDLKISSQPTLAN